MSNNSIARVRYFERQFLRTEDFQDEQAYHLAMRRRHNIAHHVWGIVCGLDLVADRDGLFVQPGMAVDGYGRELIVPEKQPLPGSRFDDLGRDKLDVWLEYHRVGSELAPEGYGGCSQDSGRSPYRWEEWPLIRLDEPAPEALKRQPEGVPEGDLEFDPSRTPPDDLLQAWPVFLGQVLREQPNPGQDYVYTVKSDNRPYAVLRGEKIVAPSGRAKVQIGAEAREDTRRFAVFVPEAGSNSPPLEISKEGQIDIRGTTTVHGNLLLKGRALVLGKANIGPPPSEPAWRIYHQYEEHKDTDQETAEHQLRIEMPPGGSHSVVIGAWSEDDKTFNPSLTVDRTGTVTVHGDLIVKGNQIITPSKQEGVESLEVLGGTVRGGLSDEAKRFLQAGMLSGVSGANMQLDRFYRRLGGGEEATSSTD